MRWILGPSFRTTLKRPAAPATPPADATPAPVAKLDVEVVGKGVVNDVATFGVSPYDPATHNVLLELRAYAVPEGADVPLSGDAFVASDYKFVTGTLPEPQTGGDVSVALPAEVPDGDYFVQSLLGFES
jgi:hypothetical protein